MKLKTLKDLKTISYNVDWNSTSYKDFVLKEELKAEAIKQIRFLRENKWLAKDIIKEAEKLSPEELIINYIKWENNITEELV